MDYISTSVSHALLFSNSERIRRYVAADASRNSHLYSRSLLKQAFLDENNETIKSWLAMALARSGDTSSLQNINNWAGNVDDCNEDRWWGVIGGNIIAHEYNYIQKPWGRIDSSDSNEVILGFVESYHIRNKDSEMIRVINRSLASGDDDLIRWSLTSISNSSNYKDWNLVFDIMRNSDNPKVREWCAWAISSACKESNFESLTKHIEKESNRRVREWLYKAVWRVPDIYTPGFLIEAFGAENDPMIKEGVVQGLLSCKGVSYRKPFKHWLINFCDSIGEDVTPEEELLVSKVIEMYREVRIEHEDMDVLLGLGDRMPWSVILHICGILKHQLSRHTSYIFEEEIHIKISEFFQKKSRIIKELESWEQMVRGKLPIVVSDVVYQHHSSMNESSLGISQRATVFAPDGSENIRVVQGIENVKSDGNIVQKIFYNNQRD